MTKTCKKCGILQSSDNYYSHKQASDGLHTRCKTCLKSDRSTVKQKTRSKQYYTDNKEEIRASQKKYSESKQGKESLRNTQRKYFQGEKGRDSLHRGQMKRRSYKHHVRFTVLNRSEILDRDNHTCQYCHVTVHDRSTGDWNTPDKAHIDHITPISKGGTSDPDNLQVLCRTCNLSKSNKQEE